MLYNPKWETKPDVFSLEGLIAWLEKQPVETTYNWLSFDCLGMRYLKDMGSENPVLDYDNIDVNIRATVFCRFGIEATYGAALLRAKSLLRPA